MNPKLNDIINRLKGSDTPDNARGAVLLTVVFVLIIIGLVGSAMYSLTYTSTFTQMSAQNATRAYYIAESGFRVVAAEYNQADAANKNTTLESLHNENLTLPDNDGQIDIRLYPYWFYVNSAYSSGNNSISLKMPGGIPITDLEDPAASIVTIPGSGKLKLQGKTRRATINASSSVGDVITFSLASPGFPYDIQTDEELFLVYTDGSTPSPQTLGQDATLLLVSGNPVAQFLPAENGSFRIFNEENDRMDYTYRQKITTGGFIGLTGIRSQDPDPANPSVFPISVDSTSEIYFGKNLAVVATTALGLGLFAGQKTVVTHSEVGLDGGFNIGRENISFEDDIEDFNYGLPTNDPDPPSGDKPIEVDETNKEINLGGRLNDGYGSIWYGGDSDTANCIDGNCNLGKGFRAYFEFVSNLVDNSDESTTYGDGFTFSIISGVYEVGPGYRNTKYDTGGPLGEYLGYAGPGLSGDGLKPPKIALEIDTFPNPGAGSICGSNSRNDGPPAANHIALDYWGAGTLTNAPGSLDATGGYMRIGSATPSNGNPEDWSSAQGTISFWFKRDTIFYGDGSFSGDRMWGQAADMEMRFSSNGYDLFLDWGGDEALKIIAGKSTYSSGLYNHPFITPDKWYFMAITWNETNGHLTMYWGDESTLPTILATNIVWDTPVSTVVGITENLFLNSSGGSDGLKNFTVDGQGTDLRYFDIDREVGQLQLDYHLRLDGTEAGLQAYYPLESDFANAAALLPTAESVPSTGWSAEVPSVFPACGGAIATLDDNRHGSGSGAQEPMNSLNNDPVSGDDGYYQVEKAALDPNWMEDGLLYGVRLELIRPKLPNGSVYEYQIKAWTVCVDATCADLDATQKANFSDTRATYDGSDPQIELTLKKGNPLELAESVHQDLKSILFGFTQGTGGATQDITLKNMEMRFNYVYPVSDLSTW